MCKLSAFFSIIRNKIMNAFLHIFCSSQFRRWLFANEIYVSRGDAAGQRTLVCHYIILLDTKVQDTYTQNFSHKSVAQFF